MSLPLPGDKDLVRGMFEWLVGRKPEVHVVRTYLEAV
jgi:hypothetical protein